MLAFSEAAGTIDLVILKRGAPSIAMGRTPHELHDEMCRPVAPRMRAMRMPAFLG